MLDPMYDREKGFEAKQKLDEEMTFKAHARGHKRLGLWIAEKLRITGREADDYAKSLVMAGLDAPADHAVIDKIMADIRAKGIDLSEDEVRSKMLMFFAQARRDLNNEYPEPLGDDYEKVGD